MKKLCLMMLLFSAVAARGADDTPGLAALARMPVKEVTVFKDGHAFVLHQGELPTDSTGNVLMDYLPAPVLGTFWPYVAAKDVKLSGVTAGQRRVKVERTPLSIRELIEANPGAAVTITEAPVAQMTPPVAYQATIVGVTERSASELEAVSPPNSGELLPQKGDVVLLRTEAGTKAVSLTRVLDVTFKDPPRNAWGNVEFRNLLTTHLDWGKRKPAKQVEMELMYLQRGIRWIPQYQIRIDGKGQATIRLQATLLNELTDLNDVTCHLVVGVPTFQFKDTVDPIALQQNLAQLSQYFREADPTAGQYQMLSNALMTQAPRMSEYRAREARPADLGPEVGGTADNVEDLHIFTVRHLTLKKGQRMVVPVTEFTVPYKDVFVLELPFAPPPEVARRWNNQQQGEIARLLATPKVMHKIRLENKSDNPFTTAPALIVRDDRVLGQGLMTYTSKGGSVDLPVTAAVDIRVKKTDNELKRTPNALNWDGNNYAKIELAGTIALTNYRKQPVDLEVTRHVLGNVTEASQNGTVEMVNVFEDASFAPAGGHGYPHWWGWWDWPYWWNRLNGVGRITWKPTLEPGKSIELKYDWHYFWR